MSSPYLPWQPCSPHRLRWCAANRNCLFSQAFSDLLIALVGVSPPIPAPSSITGGMFEDLGMTTYNDVSGQLTAPQ